MTRRLKAALCALVLVASPLSTMFASPASATLFNWPGGWTNPAGGAQWQDWNFNQCGYASGSDGHPWAHLGNDSQGYKSGAVRSIGNGTVKRVINATAPNNGLMVEYQSTAGPFTLIYQHVNPGVGVGATVGAGAQIGTVANWPPAGSNNHVHVSLVPGAYTGNTSWYGYRDCTTGAGGGGGHVNPIPWLAANQPASTSITEGQFVSYAGHVYRIAGGAPLYVSSWDRFGGPKPTTGLSDAQWNALPTYPRDGTLISGQAPGHPDHGTVYRIAGGAPIYVSSYAHIGGDPGTVAVDLSAIHNAGGGAPWHHLRYRPAEGTLISGWAPGHPEHGSVYRIAGGAPIYVSSFAHIGGDPGTAGVDLAAIHNAGGGGRWSHLNWFPTDGTYVDIADGSVLRFAGGAPIPVSHWDNVGGYPHGTPVVRVDHVALSNAGRGGLWNHVSYHPADGTVLDANGTKYRVMSGVASPFSTSTAGTRIDPVAIQRAGQPGLWSHLKAPVVAPVPVPAPTTPTTTPTTATPPPAPTTATDVRTLTVRAVRDRTALLVIVGPASATGDYAFIVQKRSRKGTWKRIVSTTTRGPKDMRVLDLRRGVYRVFAPSVNGLQRIDSRTVRLRR